MGGRSHGGAIEEMFFFSGGEWGGPLALATGGTVVLRVQSICEVRLLK